MSEPVKYTKSGKLVNHGTAGAYTNHKCRCEKCREAWAAQHQSTKKRAAAKGVPYHGTEVSYSYYGCRCDRCREAATTGGRERARRARAHKNQ